VNEHLKILLWFLGAVGGIVLLGYLHFAASV
jgi:hypothetical protein